jgi:tripartite-type tricarboxylate transporter receptor subunit TctC
MTRLTRRSFLHASLGASVASLGITRLSGPAHAQSYPSRNVRMVVPYAAGGTTDFVARVVAEKMSELANGYRFFVENKAGAAGAIGMKDVAASEPDGYTVLLGDSTMAVTPTLTPGAGIDPLKMFRPVSLIATFPSVLVVHPSVPAKTVDELIAYAKQNPGKMNFGSGGNGTVPHLQGEQFKLKTGTNLQHVPYRGAAAALQDVVAGQIQMLFTAAPTANAFIEGGQLRLIATTGAERLPIAAGVPTLVEAGVKDFVSSQWFGLLAPAKTPEPVVTRLNELAVQAARDPGVAKRITDQGGFLQPGSPEDFTRFIEGEIKSWGDIVRAAKVQ